MFVILLLESCGVLEVLKFRKFSDRNLDDFRVMGIAKWEIFVDSCS